VFQALTVEWLGQHINKLSIPRYTYNKINNLTLTYPKFVDFFQYTPGDSTYRLQRHPFRFSNEVAPPLNGVAN
jgi:hypothetical protein